MSSRAVVQFRRELNHLFEKRTFWIRKAIADGTTRRPPVLRRKQITKVIECLQSLATKCLADDFAHQEWNRVVRKKKQWHVTRGKGWGRSEKKDHFNKWFTRYIPFKNCIYIFWAKRRCIYVGRTVNGKGRPQSHFIKFWFGSVTRIDIFSTSAASHVPKLECLAIHRFRPRENGMKASIPKWAKKCPVCVAHELIADELRRIFALRK